MRLARASLAALLLSRCAPAVPPTADPPTAPAPSGVLPPGQSPSDERPPGAVEPPLDPRLLRTMRALIARDGPGFARAYRDTVGLLRGQAAARHAVPVSAGRCYRIHVAAEAGVGDLGLRLFDGEALLEEDGSYGAYALLGHRRPLCPEGDRVWRLELSASEGGRYVVSVLARRSADGADTSSAVPSTTW